MHLANGTESALEDPNILVAARNLDNLYAEFNQLNEWLQRMAPKKPRKDKKG